MFAKVEDEGKRALKLLLHQGGIYTGRRNESTVTQFVRLLTVKELPEWRPEEIKRMDFNKKSEVFEKQQGL